MESDSRGKRVDLFHDGQPMCLADFLEWHTQKCPSYRRLSKEAAQRKWHKDLQDKSIKKDQVQAVDLAGRETGLVWRIWVTTNEVQRDSAFAETQVGFIKSSTQIKAPSEAQLRSFQSVAKELAMEKGLGIGVDFQEDSGIQASGAVNLPLQAKVAQQQNITGPRTSQAQGHQALLKLAPSVAAPKLRLKSMKAFNDAKMLNTKALAGATAALDAMRKSFGPDLEEQSDDPRLQQILHRENLAKILASQSLSHGNLGQTLSRQIHELVQQDDFLKEEGFEEKSCQSIGQLTYARDMLMNLQPNVESLLQFYDDHLESIRCLKTCSEALKVAAEQYLANSAAEKKARKLEQDMRDKEEKRLEKEKQKDEKKRKRKEEQAKKKEAEAAAKKQAREEAERNKENHDPDGPEVEEEEPEKPRKKKSRNPALGELQPADPDVLKVSSSIFDPQAADSLENMASMLVDNKHQVVRLREGKSKKVSCKKVMQAGPQIQPDTINSWVKTLNASFVEFKAKFGSLQTARVSKSYDAPGVLLGMDWLIGQELDAQGMGGSAAQILEKGYMFDRQDLTAMLPLEEDPSAQGDASIVNQQKIYKANGLTMQGFQLGSTLTSFLPGGLPCFHYQLEGSRIIALMDFEEIQDYMGLERAAEAEKSGKPYSDIKPTLPDCAKWLENLSQEKLQGMDETPWSFKVFYMGAGELVYFPAGVLVVEKCVMVDSFCSRVNSMLVDKYVIQRLQLCKSHGHGNAIADLCILKFDGLQKEATLAKALAPAAAARPAQPQPPQSPQPLGNGNDGGGDGGASLIALRQKVKEEEGDNDKDSDSESQNENKKSHSKHDHDLPPAAAVCDKSTTHKGQLDYEDQDLHFGKPGQPLEFDTLPPGVTVSSLLGQKPLKFIPFEASQVLVPELELQLSQAAPLPLPPTTPSQVHLPLPMELDEAKAESPSFPVPAPAPVPEIPQAAVAEAEVNGDIDMRSEVTTPKPQPKAEVPESAGVAAGSETEAKHGKGDLDGLHLAGHGQAVAKGTVSEAATVTAAQESQETKPGPQSQPQPTVEALEVPKEDAAEADAEAEAKDGDGTGTGNTGNGNGSSPSAAEVPEVPDSDGAGNGTVFTGSGKGNGPHGDGDAEVPLHDAAAATQNVAEAGAAAETEAKEGPGIHDPELPQHVQVSATESSGGGDNGGELPKPVAEDAEAKHGNGDLAGKADEAPTVGAGAAAGHASEGISKGDFVGLSPESSEPEPGMKRKESESASSALMTEKKNQEQVDSEKDKASAEVRMREHDKEDCVGMEAVGGSSMSQQDSDQGKVKRLGGHHESNEKKIDAKQAKTKASVLAIASVLAQAKAKAKPKAKSQPKSKPKSEPKSRSRASASSKAGTNAKLTELFNKNDHDQIPNPPKKRRMT